MWLLSGMPTKTETQTSMGPCGDIIVLDQPAGKTDAGYEDEKVKNLVSHQKTLLI